MLPIFTQKMFSYTVLKTKSGVLACSNKEIIIIHKKLRLPFKVLHLEANQIQAIYFDEILWNSTIGLLMENKSLITLNFSRGLKKDYYDSKSYLITFIKNNNLSIINGPDRILKKLFLISASIYLVYYLCKLSKIL
ncbi:hypothetical protein [Leptospira meyeri]|uniref:hypothetical protein n=1 Tax=Leptospira meyeri TaxID=29508 RepID=UPI001AEF5AD2|nr:hypothetical protein [Leptospira meyeri]